MLNYIWGGMIIVSLIAGFFTGRLSETAAAALDGAGSAVDLCISLLAIMAFWTGLMRIAEKGGLVKIISKPLKPLLSKLFKGVGRDSDAMHSMIMNITANLLGMGNAATPLGIDATVKLHELNHKSKFASNAMCLFIVLNTASIQILPTTVISLRQTYGSSEPAAIIPYVWIAEICALTVGITVAKLCEKYGRKIPTDRNL